LLATERAIAPIAPVPLPPKLSTSRAALEDAFQEHTAPLVVIAALPVPHAAANVAIAGVMPVTLHTRCGPSTIAGTVITPSGTTGRRDRN